MIDLQTLKNFIYPAHHGTCKRNAEKIGKSGFTLPSTNPELFLGHGVYFYDDSVSLARQYAKRCAKENNDETAVLEACIEKGQMLNLFDLDDQKEYSEFKNDVIKKLHRPEIAAILKNKGHIDSKNQISDAVVLDLAMELFPLDTIKAGPMNLETRKYLFSGSMIPKFSAIIICVRNLSMISRVKIVE